VWAKGGTKLNAVLEKGEGHDIIPESIWRELRIRGVRQLPFSASLLPSSLRSQLDLSLLPSLHNCLSSLVRLLEPPMFVYFELSNVPRPCFSQGLYLHRPDLREPTPHPQPTQAWASGTLPCGGPNFVVQPKPFRFLEFLEGSCVCLWTTTSRTHTHTHTHTHTLLCTPPSSPRPIPPLPWSLGLQLTDQLTTQSPPLH